MRFGIPGAICLMVGFSNFAAVALITGMSIETTAKDVSLAITVFVVVSTVPIGFVLYQMYYAMYRPVFLGRLIVEDRAARILASLPAEYIGCIRTLFNARIDITRYDRTPFNRIKRTSLRRFFGKLHVKVLDEEKVLSRYSDAKAAGDVPTSGEVPPHDGFAESIVGDASDTPVRSEYDRRSPARIYAYNWRENRHVLDAIIRWELADDTKNKHFVTALFRRTDILHGLGACRVAIIVGWLAGTIGVLAANNADPSWLTTAVALVAAFSATALVFYFVHRSRAKTWHAYMDLAEYSLRIALRDPAVAELTEPIRLLNEYEPRPELFTPEFEFPPPKLVRKTGARRAALWRF